MLLMIWIHLLESSFLLIDALGRGNRVDLLILKGLRALRFITFDMVRNHNTI
jgi:hypothetical protein